MSSEFIFEVADEFECNDEEQDIRFDQIRKENIVRSVNARTFT